MKRLLILLSIAFVALMSMCFTSCDEDQMIAMNIQGTWRGTISTNYYKSWWSLDQGGDYYTIFHFSGDLGSRHGHGYEIDFTRNNQSASRSRFEYWVKGSEVEITFENGRRFYIYGITTDGGHLRGYIDDGSGRNVNIDLISDSRNYDSYAKGAIENKR